MTPKLAIEPCSPVSNAKNQTREAGTVLLDWLRIFSRHYRYPMTKDDLPIYAEALCDLTAEQIDAACKSALKACRFWPTVADIRAQLDQAGAKGFELEAEEEWRKALSVATEFFHPDIGLYRNVPKLSAATWHALKVAGGLEHLQSCKREELQWVRRRFIADYTLIHETRQVEHLLGDGDKKILSRILAGQQLPDRKQLTAAEPEGKLPPRAEVSAVLERIAGSRPLENRRERKKREEMQKVREWKIEHGLAVDPLPVDGGEKSPILRPAGMP
jgi:hypothetical protein